jgi:hypothetical protein
MYLNPSQPFYRQEPKRTPKMALINATHVCHHWRNVALQCPRLWCYIDFNRHPDYVRVAIERSEDCSLYAWGDVHDGVISSVSILLGAVGRLCYLAVRNRILDARSTYAGSLFMEHLEAPRLLEFEEGYDSSTSVPRHYRTDGSSFSVLTKLITQNLRSVSIAEPTDAVFHVLRSTPSIRQLTLSWLDTLPSGSGLNRHRLRLSNIVTTLQHFTSLRALALRGLDLSSSELITDLMVDLPQLEKLQIHGNYLCYMLVSNHFTIPSSAAITISGIYGGAGHVISNEFTTALSTIKRIADSNKEDPGTLAGMELVVLPDHDQPVLRGWTKIQPQYLAAMADQANIHSQFSIHVSLDRNTGLAPSVRSHRPIFDVRRLHIQGAFYGEEAVSSIQSIGECVEDLTFTDGYGHGFICTVLRRRRNADSPVIFPNLRTLRIDNWTICSRTHAIGYRSDWSQYRRPRLDSCRDCQLPTRLLAVLKHRRAIGLPVLQELAFSNNSWVLTTEEEAGLVQVVTCLSQDPTPSHEKFCATQTGGVCNCRPDS